VLHAKHQVKTSKHENTKTANNSTAPTQLTSRLHSVGPHLSHLSKPIPATQSPRLRHGIEIAGIAHVKVGTQVSSQGPGEGQGEKTVKEVGSCTQRWRVGGQTDRGACACACGRARARVDGRGELHGLSTSSRALARGLARFTPGPLGLDRGRGVGGKKDRIGLGGQMEVVEVGVSVSTRQEGDRASMVGERGYLCACCKCSTT
jgi:hypothetical protein